MLEVDEVGSGRGMFVPMQVALLMDVLCVWLASWQEVLLRAASLARTPDKDQLGNPGTRTNAKQG